MDLATILGIAISFGLVIMAMLLGGSPVIFVDVPSMLIVLGGTVGATLTHYPLPVVLGLGKIIRKTLIAKTTSSQLIIDQFMDYANRARREGILALEPVIKSMDNAYVQKGMQLTVDGLEPEAIQSIMETEISNTEGRHGNGVDLLNALASYAPALGMIGTVIGLVQMLQSMEDPSSIGPAMAVALITTFYGAVLANLVFIPLAGKLKKRSADEIQIMEMQMEGVLGIARGENPRIIAEKLSSFQPPKERKQQ
ncbi:MotA/TolQ/ExbB proton channel family protein [Desulfovibrio sp. OttesenSCG-928-I05]|nr:MotA/TolQ/ExbB proton channel family protein [Desulfovibrio sp. OttesenSCG-928-I05]